jgi:hypothetical protein
MSGFMIGAPLFKEVTRCAACLVAGVTRCTLEFLALIKKIIHFASATGSLREEVTVRGRCVT